MKILSSSGNERVATVFTAETSAGNYVEFVESKNPPLPIKKKWVLIISTLSGCPISCPMCDAGSLKYNGKLSKEEMFEQIDFLIDSKFSNRTIPVEKFKIQFARVGEPALNSSVLGVLKELQSRYKTIGLIPAISTVAPNGREEFFENLLEIKNEFFKNNFQLQFSIHTTCEDTRKTMIPTSHWNFEKIAKYGNRFVQNGNRKITLNFAAMKSAPIDAKVIADYFSPSKFLIKFTPLNPTNRASNEGLLNSMDINDPSNFSPAKELSNLGFDVILSIGELEENQIGSNCGQFIKAHLENDSRIDNAYTYT